MSHPQLGTADKRAVDMLLNHLAQSHPSSFAATVPAVDPERLEAARKVLGSLDAFEVNDPPLDLAERTVSRVNLAPRNVAPTDIGTSRVHLDA